MDIQFNTNILETNIINLAVVIVVVISFVGDALRSLLENRQQLILANLSEADKRAKKAQEKLIEAKSQFEAAKLKSEEIAKQGIVTLNKDKDNSQIQTEEMIQRLDKLKKETLLSQQQKALKLLSKKVIQSSLTQVQEKLQKRIDSKFQTSINNFYIALLRNYGF
uniref:ATP synthase CF0 subunit I n=1 Tax=Ostreobium quekettii TaxID=121088 RepID=A0A1A8H176_9CHLO|nr:ATP synthase CF0 subunit I [Ostreobium quekettii]SBQ77014.1 ATP synthase CF0 subunit I [Ostreobium quekettii]